MNSRQHTPHFARYGNVIVQHALFTACNYIFVHLLSFLPPFPCLLYFLNGLEGLYKQQANPILSVKNYTPLVIRRNDKNKQLTLLADVNLH
jgi:hypothetical protein